MYDDGIGMTEGISACEAVETRGIRLAELTNTSHNKLPHWTIVTCCRWEALQEA